jgi:hypothetical protein
MKRKSAKSEISEEKTEKQEPFSRIDMLSKGDVTCKFDTDKLTLVSPTPISARASDGVLTIGGGQALQREWTFEQQQRMVDRVISHGTGNITLCELVLAPDVNFKTTSSGNIQLFEEVMFDRVTAHVTGHGDINVCSVTKSIEVDLSGSGNVSGFSVLEKGFFSISGSGDAVVAASKLAKIGSDVSGESEGSLIVNRF